MAMYNELTTVDSLIDSIRSCEMPGESFWARFLDQLSASIPDSRTVLIVHDDLEPRASAILTSRSFEQRTIEAYNNHYAALNPLPGLLSRKHGHGGFSDEQLIRLTDLRTSEYFNDFLCPNGMDFSAGIKIADGAGRSILLGVNAPRDAVKSIDVVNRLTLLAPHVRQAFAHYRAVAYFENSGHAQLLLEAADVGVMVLGRDQQIRMTSPTMDRLLQAADALIQVSPLKGVRLKDEAAQTVLSAMLKEQAGVLKVFSRFYGQVKLTLISLKTDRVLSALEGPMIGILLQKYDLHAQAFDQEHFSRVFRLTKAEGRAMAGIVAGKSIDQIAREALVTRETIRSQVKSLYTKTGVQSMKDIVRLALARPTTA